MKTFDFLLHLKSWEVFLILLAGGSLKTCQVEDMPMLSALLSAVGTLVIAGWVVVVGHRLYHHFPGLSSMNYRLFTVCSIFWVLAIVLLQIMKAFIQIPFGYKVTIPVAILLFCVGCYCAFFTARMLESVDAGKEVSVRDSLGSLFLLAILPVGIWFFQPIIRKAMKSRWQASGAHP